MKCSVPCSAFHRRALIGQPRGMFNPKNQNQKNQKNQYLAILVAAIFGWAFLGGHRCISSGLETFQLWLDNYFNSGLEMFQQAWIFGESS
jgi:hypothetical protein